MGAPYISQADLELRLSKALVARLFDDDNDGDANTDAVTQLLTDATSKVNSYLQPVYPLDRIATAVPNEVKRLTLDVALAFAAQRHPEVVRRDWKELMSAAEADLDKLRTRKVALDIQVDPEGGATEQTTVEVQGSSPCGGQVTPPPRRFDDMGDF